MFPQQVVNRYIEEGTAELVPGVLFIDEVLIFILSFSYYCDSPSVFHDFNIDIDRCTC